MKLSDLKPNERNPRKISKEKRESLAKALAAFGDLGGIIFNKRSGKLVGGHQRISVLPKNSEITITQAFDTPTPVGTVAEGYVEVAGERFKYREVDWDEKTEIEALLAANKHGGEWDKDILKITMEAFPDLNWELTGFDAPQISKEGLCDPDEVPEVTEPKAKLGDIYQLGNHRLMCADSTQIDAVEKLMAGEKADLWITDPPYGVGYKSNGAEDKHDAIANDNLPLAEMKDFWQQVAMNALIVSSDKASYYWFACQGGDQMMMMMMMSLGEAAWRVRHELIWVKDTMVMGRCDYHYKHEPIFYGWKAKGTHEWHSDRKQTSVLEFPRPKKSEQHPTMKPVDLIAYLIGNSSKPNQIILDTFGGSGTTLIACEKISRAARLIEVSPKYVDSTIARWEKFSGQKAVLISS